jgi:hypothetical protein
LTIFAQQKNGRGRFFCPEAVSTLKKVGDYRKMLTTARCSEIVSKMAVKDDRE